MGSSAYPTDSQTPGSGRFSTTHWSVVLATRDSEPELAREALGRLCATYWYPVYACLRRRSYQPADAEDLTQGFLQSLLERQAFQHADPVRGRLRSYLLACLNQYLHSQTEKRARQKRGGGIPHVSLDAMAAEERYRLEPVERYTPEQLFERRWALTVIETALDRLREETSQGGRGELFLELKNAIVGDPSRLPYAEIAGRLGISNGAVSTMVHRWRRRYRDLCRAEVAHTVLDPAEVEAEMRHLLRVLRD